MKKLLCVLLSSIILFTIPLQTGFAAGSETAAGSESSFKSAYDLKINGSYYGFVLQDERYISEINSIGRLFYHRTSGARLLSLENDDNNKAFSISFRTPSEDSTGVAHILEHSVLAGGSRKFPVKQVITELSKSSMNTYLNAMTFADKTMYPVASTNEKDLLNLMDVYLDCVLYPDIYRTPEILLEERGRYETVDSGELDFTGVVYNEMKGAFSSPGRILGTTSQASLFPDTSYRFVSGGDPGEIPSLTQGKFEAFHKKYYRPSNSYIYLYGNGNLMEQLKLIGEGYLKDFKKDSVNSAIQAQKAFDKMAEKTVEYGVSKDESAENKAFFSMNFVLGDRNDQETTMAFELIADILMGNQSAPLKKKLLEAGIGKDFSAGINDALLQPVFSFDCSNTNESEKEKFRDIVFTTLKELVGKGIDKKLIEASINKIEFDIKEGVSDDSLPTGLIYGIWCMNGWLYDESPIDYLQFGERFKNVKKALNSDYLEKLIQKHILDNSHASFVAVVPKKGLSEENAESYSQKMKNFKSKLTKAQLEAIEKNSQKLKEWQESGNDQESLKTIPVLKLSDIDLTVEKLPMEIRNEDGITILQHKVFSKDIAYTSLFFDTTGVKEEQIPYVRLLTQVLGRLDTQNYALDELSREIKANTGGIALSTAVFRKYDDSDVYYPKLKVEGKAFTDKLPKLLELMKEQMLFSKLDDKSKLKSIISQEVSAREAEMSGNGHSIAVNRLFSYISQSRKYSDVVNGLSYYRFLKELEENFDTRADELVQGLKDTAADVLTKGNLTASITADNKGCNEFAKNLGNLCKDLGDVETEPQDYKFQLLAQNEGLSSPSTVQYVAKGYNFKKNGMTYSPKYQVAAKIISEGYLWDAVRIKGGAYGAGMVLSQEGILSFWSYRDPNLVETLSAYNEAARYIEGFTAGEGTLEPLLISVLANYFIPVTPESVGVQSDAMYFTGVTDELLQSEVKDIASTTQNDIRAFAAILSGMSGNENICVIGSKKKLEENRTIFGNLSNLVK